jgi:transposase
MIALIQQLYEAERASADMTHDARRAHRQAHAVPLLAKIKAERDRLAEIVLPKSPLGDAVRYLTNQWDALQRFVDDGRLAADNNRAENQLRVVALGRTNWFFAWSFEGARRTALLYSLVQSCTLAGVPPFEYLKDVLLRVATHPQRLISQLTPQGWAATFRPSVAA